MSDLFGMKFSLALGAWRLRFVLMLEDTEPAPAARPAQIGHHIAIVRDASNAGLN